MGILIAIIRELPAWILVSLGFYTAYRVLKFPDLTVDASFITGTVGAACAAIAWQSSLLGLFIAIILGTTAGICTGIIYLSNPRPAFKLLASVLVLLAYYSVNYRVLGHNVSVGFVSESTAMNQLITFEADNGLNVFRPFSLMINALVVIVIYSLYYILLKSNFGLILRSLGTRPQLASKSRVIGASYLVIGLGICNGTVAIGGWLYASGNGFASINVFGTIIHALAAALLGEAIVERTYKGPDRRVAVLPILLAPFFGAVLYQALRATCSWFMSQASMNSEKMISVNVQDFNTIVAVSIVLLIILVRWIAYGSGYELIGSNPSSGEGD